jgi:outer membrane protein assembly factor BamB
MQEEAEHTVGHAGQLKGEPMMRPWKRIILMAVVAGGLLLAGQSSRGADWPMFGRDDTRNAVSPEKDPPREWQIEQRDRNGFLLQPAWNILWEAQLGSSNAASPVVARGLVWIGTNNARPRDLQVKGDAAVLMCFRERDGRFLWQYVSPRLRDQYHQDWPYAGIKCSPLIEGDRLWFVTNRAEIVCLDIGPLQEGKGEPRPVWKLDMRKELGVHPVGAAMNVGFTCSIGASYKGRIYVTTGNGMGDDGRTVPAPQAPSLLCLDRDTGKVLWSDSSPGKNILYDQGSSPLVVEIRGRGQVIVGQGDGWVRSFDALTGQLIWRFDTNPKAAAWNGGNGTRSYVIATPVFHDGRVYVGNGRSPVQFSTKKGRLCCIDSTKEGDISPELDDGPGKGKPNPNSGLVWCFESAGKRDEDQMHDSLSSVAIADGLVIAPDAEGLVHCLDARTGKTYWTHDTLRGIQASPLIADGLVYVPAMDGTVTILALSRELKPIAAPDMDDGIAGTPVFANGVLYIAAGARLYAIKTVGSNRVVAPRPPGHWPQWRGPGRSNVSLETGLLPRWSKDGPPLAWKVEGLGQGTASVAVAGGRCYTPGYQGEDEYLTALEEATGKKAWTVRIGPAMKENPVMRWLSQRVPTVDEDRIYIVTAGGDLVCLQTADGKELWRKSYPNEFAGKSGPWGYCDRPLVDGERLICTPGGAAAAVLAL